MTGAPSGLREAHAHIISHGRSASMLWLSSCTSRGEALDLIRARARAMASNATPHAPRTQWLIAAGARPQGWHDADHAASQPGRHGAWPTHLELDDACPDRPCLVMSFDHHSGAANSAALAAAFGAIDPDRATQSVPTKSATAQADASATLPEVFVRDPGGRFTGVLLEAAFMRVRHAVPQATATERMVHLRAALDDFARLGFDEVHDLWSGEELGPGLAELEREGTLSQRVWMYPLVDGEGTLERVHATRSAFASSRVRLTGGKVFADGTLNATTAWMRQPYRDGLADHPCGTPLVSVESLRRDMNRCWALGIGMAVHAIGDGAVGAVLDAAEAESANPAIRAVRDAGLPPVRIEHAEVVDERDVPRIVRLWREMGLVVSVQPCHLLYDIEALERQLPHRLHRVLPLRELIQAGLPPGDGLWFGSDAPIVRPDPQDSIDAATTRRRGERCVAGPASRAIAAEQSIDESTAWTCFGRDRTREPAISTPPQRR